MDITDVDFRYVMRKPASQYATIRELMPVLQWRKKVCVAGMLGKWTDWQDVRTEEE